MAKTKNDLPESTRTKMASLLNARLADAIDLMMQAKQAHWNVKGPEFIALHELFDKVVTAAGEAVDLIAERAVQLGAAAEGTIRIAAKRSELPEYPLDIVDGRAHVNALSDRLAAFGKSTRAAIRAAADAGDDDTADIFTEISRDADKYLWFVEAHANADR
jgi:starvation-inducible DNA-binding protein